MIKFHKQRPDVIANEVRQSLKTNIPITRLPRYFVPCLRQAGL